jgi:hypothetical protein
MEATDVEANPEETEVTVETAGTPQERDKLRQYQVIGGPIRRTMSG